MDLTLNRIHHKLLTSSGTLCKAAREAEATTHQDLATDLWRIWHELERVRAAAERNRYQSPLEVEV